MAQILSEDFSKLAVLCFDRSVVFHSRAGTHHRVRVPRFGRDLAFHPYTADLFVAASGSELYRQAVGGTRKRRTSSCVPGPPKELRPACRLNLEEGRFQTPLASRSPGVNKLGISPVHGLVAAAGEEGLLECFDVRQEKCAGRLDVAAAIGAVSLKSWTRPGALACHRLSLLWKCAPGSLHGWRRLGRG